MLHFAGERSFAAVHKSVLEDYKKGPAKDAEAGAAADAVKKAKAGKHAFVGCIDLSQVPPDLISEALAQEQLKPFEPLFKAKAVHASAAAGKGVKFELAFPCDKEGKADDAEKALELLKSLASDEIKKALKDEGAKKKLGAILPLMEQARGGRRRGQGQPGRHDRQGGGRTEGRDRLGQARGRPRPAVASRGGQGPGVQQPQADRPRPARLPSRVRRIPAGGDLRQEGQAALELARPILPYIEQQNLYNEFKLDEPWDSDHNKKLLAKMPKTYAVIGAAKGDEAKTRYRVFVGGGAAFDWIKGAKIGDFADGTSNTILAVETAGAVSGRSRTRSSSTRSSRR